MSVVAAKSKNKQHAKTNSANKSGTYLGSTANTRLTSIGMPRLLNSKLMRKARSHHWLRVDCVDYQTTQTDIGTIPKNTNKN